jgi:hypothetical protein
MRLVVAPRSVQRLVRDLLIGGSVMSVRDGGESELSKMSDETKWVIGGGGRAYDSKSMPCL